MPTVKRFEDLEIWQEARELVKLVYALTTKFSKNEIFGLASQMQRAAVSVMSIREYLKTSGIKGQKFHDEREVYVIEQPET